MQRRFSNRGEAGSENTATKARAMRSLRFVSRRQRRREAVVPPAGAPAPSVRLVKHRPPTPSLPEPTL